LTPLKPQFIPAVRDQRVDIAHLHRPWHASLRQGTMQRPGVLVSALSFAFPRPAGVAGIEWRLSSFSRSVREISCPLLEVKAADLPSALVGQQTRMIQI
jgi:hypothetical protein